MAEHDYVIANQNGANTRSDLNNALAAIVSNNSKATAPATTYAFMWWADTANDLLKQRNAADSAWVDILTLSTGAVSNAAIADDAVTLAKMAAGTDGELITYDTSGDPTTVPTGSSGEVLTSNGAGTTPTFQAAAGGGKVLQVVSTTKTDTYSTNSNSFVDITGMSLAITPSSTSSKILVCIVSNFSIASGYMTMSQITRDGTAIFIGGASSSRARVSAGYKSSNNNSSEHYQISYLDSPSSTSAVTYKLQLKNESTQYAYVNRTTEDSDAYGYGQRSASGIILMEIGA